MGEEADKDMFFSQSENVFMHCEWDESSFSLSLVALESCALQKNTLQFMKVSLLDLSGNICLLQR